MIRVTDVLNGKEKRYIKMMCIGASGSGKTHLASTFPKCYFLMTEPGGEDTFLNKTELSKNVVGFDRLIPNSAQDTKQSFIDLIKATQTAKEMALKGEIETLVLDNMTFLSENRWVYINEFEKELSRNGELNTQGMYGKLARWLYQFTYMNLLSCPCNVIVNVHEMLESDEALEKKPDKSTPVLANILGGFRDKADGMFSFVFYLAKTLQGKEYKYFARTNKGNQRNGKSRLALPDVIENVSYNTLKKLIDEASQQKGG